MINFPHHINFAQLIKVTKGKDNQGYIWIQKFLPNILTLLRNVICLLQNPKRLSVHRSGYTCWKGDGNTKMPFWLSRVTSFLSCNALLFGLVTEEDCVTSPKSVCVGGYPLVSFAAINRVVTQPFFCGGEALRDDPNNGCEGGQLSSR